MGYIPLPPPPQRGGTFKITCSYCGRRAAADADRCPGCGIPVSRLIADFRDSMLKAIGYEHGRHHEIHPR